MAITNVAAFLVSLGVTAIAGLFLIPAFRRAGVGQVIREDGPVWHMSKQGTPTMGGFMFIAGTIVACMTVGYAEMKRGEYTHLFVLLYSLVFALIGFLDDYRKLKKKENLGLNAGQKLFLQLVVAMLFILLMRLTGNLTSSLYIPFFRFRFALPMPVYLAFAAFVAIGTVNAVNITDGVDGLATGVSIPVAACFIAISFVQTRAALGIFSAAFTGSLLGFLIFNFHPAKVFMGDIGSHFIGGAVCALAFACDMPLILATLGVVFIIEALSDIIQVTYFKLSKGKRIFKMAPLHHHFEKSGWSEYKLFAVFTSISAVFSVISYLAVVPRG